MNVVLTNSTIYPLESLYNTGGYVCVVDINVEKLLRIEITYNLKRLLGFIMVADYGLFC